jgi:hypothetical protein
MRDRGPAEPSGRGPRTWWRGRRCGSLKNLIFKRDAFRIVFRKPFFGGLFVGKYLEVVDIASLLVST